MSIVPNQNASKTSSLRSGVASRFREEMRVGYRNPAVVYPAIPKPFASEHLIVEIGPGRGDFLFHLARLHSQAVVVGIEVKPRRVEKIIARLEKQGLTNVRMILADVRDVLPLFFHQENVDEIHIQFPDPWPKRRHSKHRAVQDALLLDCLRALKVNGTISFVTDHGPYAEEVAKRFREIPAYESVYSPVIITEKPDAFPTFFAQKWIAMGRTIHYQLYRRAR